MPVTKEILKQVIDSLIDGIVQRTIEENPEIYKKVQEVVNELPQGDLEYLYLSFILNLEICLTALDVPSDVQAILLYWPLFRCQVNNIIQEHEGSCCSVDKTRYILRCYIDAKLKNKEFRLSTEKKNFACPVTWVEDESYKWEQLISGLARLFYTNFADTKKILQDITSLYQERKEKKE